MKFQSTYSRSFLYLMLLLGASIHFAGCSGKEVDQNNPQAIFDDAEEDIKDKRYTMALEKMKTLKNKFPYSNYALKAQLRVADVHYLSEEFVEAAGSYETFRDLHPKYEKADYVLFRVGESYYNQLPGTVDRDLTPASKAIEAYRELATLYPQTEHLTESKKHLDESVEKLSQKERYIADFYYKRDMYDSAARRYEKITTKYSGSSVDQYSYWRWARSLMLQSEQPEFAEKKIALVSEAKHVLRTYLASYPSGEYSGDAKKILDKIAESSNQ